MKTEANVIIPRQVIAAVNFVLVWWIYAAIALSLAGTVLWLVAWLAPVNFSAWVTVPWITIDIIITILMAWDCARRGLYGSGAEQDTWQGVAVVGGIATFFVIVGVCTGASSNGASVGGFYSLWTLIATVTMLAIRMHFQTAQEVQKEG